MKVYEKILRPLLFALTDPEKIHKTATHLLKIASEIKLTKRFITKQCTYDDPRLITKIGHMTLPNPVGLAAGFDKNIDAPHAYSMLGFGSVEFGSITYEQQSGNTKPRLWRLPKDKGLIVNYGLSNNGAKCAALRLKKFRKQLVEDRNAKNIDNNNQLTTNYGISIAPTTSIAFDDMAEDYVKSFDLLLPYADYITLNISCPNVVSNTTTSQLNFIEKLLKTIHPKQKNLQCKKDIFIKIGSHHNTSELDQIVELSKTYELAGIVATNLLKQREGTSFYSTPKQLAHPGGISGTGTEFKRPNYSLSLSKIKW